MPDSNDEVRQEAAAMVINECRQWLTQLVQEELEKIIEDTKYITDTKRRVEKITAVFKKDPGIKAEEEAIEANNTQTEVKTEYGEVAGIQG